MARLADALQSAAATAGEQGARDAATQVLDGPQGDVLFRTGSAEMTPEMAQGIRGLAAAVAQFC